jgi:hypothetical protein
VTDPVVPLQTRLNDFIDDNLKLWGLYKIAVSLNKHPSLNLFVSSQLNGMRFLFVAECVEVSQ